MLTLLRTLYRKKRTKKDYPIEMGSLSELIRPCVHSVFRGYSDATPCLPHPWLPHYLSRSDHITPTQNPGSAIPRMLLQDSISYQLNGNSV